MKHIVDLLFEGRFLKEIPRSGFQFLGAGKESVAEHCFLTTLIAYVISQLHPDINAEKLISLCLVHDLTESRIGDLNYVQKNYVKADEKKAVAHLTRHLPFGDHLASLIDEFNFGTSIEAKIARDADQISLILELKSLADIGRSQANNWLSHVFERLKTDIGKRLANAILEHKQDSWWLKDYVEKCSKDHFED